MTPVLPCRPVTVLAFVGDRSRPFVARVLAALVEGMNGRGPGPSPLECLFLAGHAGVSTDAGATISGFHPDAGGLPGRFCSGCGTARRFQASSRTTQAFS